MISPGRTPAPPPATRFGPPGSWSCLCQVRPPPLRFAPPPRWPPAAGNWSAGGPAPPSRSAAFGRFGSCPRFFSPCFGVSSAPNRETCPLRRWISAGARREMAPYSPVKPGTALHLPQPQAPDALRHAGARFPLQVLYGDVPQDSEFRPQGLQQALILFQGLFPGGRAAGGGGDHLRQGARLSKGLASSGRKPAGRSASSSTRCSTPMVSFFPHTGHSPPRSAVSAGVRHPLQFRCPSRWYFPSSGKNSRVPRSPSPVRDSLDQLRIGEAGVQQVGLPAQPGGGGASEWDRRLSRSSADTPPVHGRVRGQSGLHSVDLVRQVPKALPRRCQSRRRHRTWQSGASRYGRG